MNEGFRIGDLRVDPQAGEVAGPKGREQLDPKVMSVLVMLAENAGKVVSREELLSRLWPDVVVTDDALTRCLYELRRQMSAAAGSEHYRALIETLPKRGYRLNSTITPIIAPPPTPAFPAWNKRALWVAAGLAAILLAWGAWRALSPPPSSDSAADARYSIAVLPFVDMSENRDQGYLSDGTSEEILNRLAQSPDLRVIARTSSFTFRDLSLDVREIGRRLEVTHVLEGSVRKAGDRVRVTAQLIATTDGAHVWSETYDRTLGDVFAIQDDVAASVASALQATLVRGSASAPRPTSIRAYDLVLQGEYHYWRRADGDLERSARLFEAATRADPGYARAWADLSGAYSMLAWSVDPPSAALRAKQGQAARRAVELAPSDGVAHQRLAQFYQESGDRENFAKHSKLARQLAPDDPLIVSDKAWAAVYAGDHGTAAALQRSVVRRDPLNSVSRHNLGIMLVLAGRVEEALASQRELVAINPQASGDTQIEIPRMLVLLSRYDEAAAEAMRMEPGKYRDQALALLWAAPAQRAEADAALQRLERYAPAPPMDTPEHTIMDAVRLAEAYAIRNRKDDALATIRKEHAELANHPERAIYTWHLRNELGLSPFLKPLLADPRWQALIRQDR